MKVLDREGNLLEANLRVSSRYGPAELEAVFLHGGLPAVRIATLASRRRVRFLCSADVNDPAGTYRCPDLLALDPNNEGEHLNG